MKRIALKLVSMLLLMVGLPLLAVNILRVMEFQQTMAGIQTMMGHELTGKEILQLWLFSTLPLPALLCALAFAGSVLDGPKVLRVISWFLLASTLCWAAFVLIRIVLV